MFSPGTRTRNRLVRLIPRWIPLHTLSLYTVVGIVATLGYLGASSGFAHLAGLRPTTSSVLGYVFGAGISYFGHRSFTFRSDVAHYTALPRFLLVSAAGLALAAMIPNLLAERLGMAPDIAFVVVSVVVASLTYTALKLAVFAK